MNLLFIIFFDLWQWNDILQYLRMRFGSDTVRIASVITFIVGTVPYMGVVLYGPSLALSQGQHNSFHSSKIILMMTRICNRVFYSQNSYTPISRVFHSVDWICLHILHIHRKCHLLTKYSNIWKGMRRKSLNLQFNELFKQDFQENMTDAKSCWQEKSFFVSQERSRHSFLVLCYSQNNVGQNRYHLSSHYALFIALIFFPASILFKGGIKAVLWTDTIQVFLMFAGLIAVMIRVWRSLTFKLIFKQ